MRPWPLWLEFFYKSWTFPPLNMLRQVPLSSSENVWESIWTPNISWDFLKRGSFHTSQGIWMILKDIEAGKPPKRPKCSIQKFQDFIGFGRPGVVWTFIACIFRRPCCSAQDQNAWFSESWHMKRRDSCVVVICVAVVRRGAGVVLWQFYCTRWAPINSYKWDYKPYK